MEEMYFKEPLVENWNKQHFANTKEHNFVATMLALDEQRSAPKSNTLQTKNSCSRDSKHQDGPLGPLTP